MTNTSPRSAASQRRHHLVAGHPRLERAQRVDLADDHRGAGAAGALGDPLAGPAVPDDDERVAGEQHVAGADDPVERRLAGAVAVVERALGARLVDREHRARTSSPSASSRRSRTRPVVVSSVPPISPSSASPPSAWRGHEQVGAVVDA